MTVAGREYPTKRIANHRGQEGAKQIWKVHELSLMKVYVFTKRSMSKSSMKYFLIFPFGHLYLLHLYNFKLLFYYVCVFL